MTLPQERIEDIIRTDGKSITDDDRAQVKAMTGQEMKDHEIVYAAEMGLI